MKYSDAPIPATDDARFSAWKQYVDENLSRLLRPRQSRYVISITGTTDTTGFLTFFHDAQVVPQGIFIQPEAPISGGDIFDAHICDSYTETTARIRALNHLGTALNSVQITFKAWVVV